MTQKDLKSYLTGISHSADKEMAVSIYTLPCCLNKARSSLEAGTKHSIAWLQFVSDVIEMLLWPPSNDSEEDRYILRKYTEISCWCRGGLKDVYGNLCSGVFKTDFVAPQTCVH